MIKSYTTVNYSLSLIVEVLSDFARLEEWEKNASKRELISYEPEEGEGGRPYAIKTAYSYFSLPFPITDRELLTATKIWKNYNGDPKQFLNCERSIEHPKYPIKEKPIRGEIIIGGMYMKETAENQTEFVMISKMDLKFTTGAGFVNKKAPEGSKDFIDNLNKFLEKRIKEKEKEKK